MWTTLQELAQIGLHIRCEIFCFHNFFVLQNHILIMEMYVESVSDYEQYLSVLHVDTVNIAFCWSM